MKKLVTPPSVLYFYRTKYDTAMLEICKKKESSKFLIDPYENISGNFTKM